MENKSQFCPKEVLTIRIDPDLKIKLNELAKTLNQTSSKLVNLSIKQLLDKDGVELPETPEKRRMAEITLLFQVYLFNQFGYEKYINEFKIFAKEFNISNEDILKVLKTIFEHIWLSSEFKNI